MKSSKLVMNLNLKRVGILSLMVLSLSVGTVKGADEFKLWHDKGPDAKSVALEKMTKDSDKADSVKWLVTDPTAENVEKFVNNFSKEPFMFMEGMKEAITAAKKENKFEALTKMVNEKLFADKPEGFGIKSGTFKDEDAKAAYKKLVKALFGMDKIDDKFLETLFKDKKLILAALNLTQVDPNAKPSPTPTPSASPKPSATPAPSSQPQPPLPPVGEQIDDAALQRQAQQICDKLNAKNEDALKAIRDQLNPIKDALNDAFNKLAEAGNAVDPRNFNNRKNERGLEDILPGLLANALNKDQQQDITPATNSQQPFPQASQRRDNTDPNQFNQPLPEQGQVPQQPNLPPPPSYGNNNFGPIRLDLPSSVGSRQMNDAESSIREIGKAESSVKTATAMASDPMALQNPLMASTLLRTLGEAKGELSNAIEMGEARLGSAKKAQQQLEEQLEELKDGARAALPESVKRKMSELERAVNEAKSQAQYQQQVINMLAPEQKQASMGDVLAAQQKVQAAESALNQYKGEVDIALEQGNSKIAGMKRKAQNLAGVVSDLEGKLASAQKKLGDVETALTTVRSTILQSQMQPMNAGTPNINKLGGFNGSSSGPRTQAPRIGNSLQTLPTAAKGGDVRGSLGAKK